MKNWVAVTIVLACGAACSDSEPTNATPQGILHCANGRQDVGELGVDCGGECGECEAGPGGTSATGGAGGTSATGGAGAADGGGTGGTAATGGAGAADGGGTGGTGATGGADAAAGTGGTAGAGAADGGGTGGAGATDGGAAAAGGTGGTGTTLPFTVWVVGAGGITRGWDGTSFQTVPSGTDRRLRDVWGSAANNVWAVGDEGTIIHWNGRRWRVVPSGVQANLEEVWGSGRNDVWAIGGTTLLRFQGTSWAAVSSPVQEPLTAIGGTGPNDVWVGVSTVSDLSLIPVAHYNGSSWTRSTDPFWSGWIGPWLEIGSIQAIGPNDVPATSWIPSAPEGYILRWDGQAWDVLRSGDGFEEQEAFSAIAGSSANDVWTVGTLYIDPSEEPDTFGFAEHFDGTRVDRTMSVDNISLFAVASRGPGDAWILAGNGTIYHFDGTNFVGIPGGAAQAHHAVRAAP